MPPIRRRRDEVRIPRRPGRSKRVVPPAPIPRPSEEPPATLEEAKVLDAREKRNRRPRPPRTATEEGV